MPIKDRDARNAYMRDYYARNPEAQKARVAKRNAETARACRKFIAAAKDLPCVDCQVKFPPCAMDFDHVRGEKLFDIGRAAGQRISMAVLLAEIAKCEVVCANCHRIRTFLRCGGKI